MHCKYHYNMANQLGRNMTLRIRKIFLPSDTMFTFLEIYLKGNNLLD